ncbi:AraC family transcriptional regulator [Methylibium sp.]|uniref:AraC family transcriptional regulator n=1 Tax=Methylibium sp. TaxID=2067992 RepID=UPI003D1363F2
MDVTIEQFPETRLAYMRHVGPYGSPGISQMWQRFAPWAAQRGLFQPGRKVLGLGQDRPTLTAPDQCRYDSCVEVDASFQPEGEVGVQVLPGGRYACARYSGSSIPELLAAWQGLFREWLPGSGWQAADGPAVEWYDRPQEIDPKTGYMSCLLCVPLRAL